MDAHEHNSCLINMPLLVLEKILSNIQNPSNVSRTCKYLYEIVCGMEKHRRLLYIRDLDATSSLNIDADAVFDSIMNSRRTIKAIELSLDDLDDSFHELNERQLERMTAIMKRFGANITSLKLHKSVLPINFILESLLQATKLESLSFFQVKILGSVAENTTMSLQLPSLRELVINITEFHGLLHIVGLITAASLNSIHLHYIDLSTESTELLATLLEKQHKIKSLTLSVYSNFYLTAAICVDHLQLETLVVNWLNLCDKSQHVELHKSQTNLRELRLQGLIVSGSSFRWICNNLKKLEVFEVYRVDSMEGNAIEMLGELTQLRHFITADSTYMFNNGFQSSQFSSDSIEKFQVGSCQNFSCGELLTKVVNSMAYNLPNLTHLSKKFDDFSALTFVLSHCTQIVHLSCSIVHPAPDQLTQQRFPNIRSLEFYFFNDNISYEMMSQSMTSIVRAMPNLKDLSLSRINRLKFDVQTMKEFIEESKSLESFRVDHLELYPEFSTDDVVETIRCLTDQLKRYHIVFRPSVIPENWNWHHLTDILSNEFYVRLDYYWNLRPFFYLYKGVEKYYTHGFF